VKLLPTYRNEELLHIFIKIRIFKEIIVILYTCCSETTVHI